MAYEQQKAAKAAKGRRLRGAVLEILDEQSPERLNADVLLGVLERLHYDVTAATLARELEYLRDAGYVAYQEMRSRQLPRVRIIEVGITRKGSDLVEGTISDPGVDLE